MVTISGALAVQHRQDDGTFVSYLPEGTDRVPLRVGDRVFGEIDAPVGATVYAIGAITRDQKYWKVDEFKPGSIKDGLIWPGGLVVDEKMYLMQTLYLVASARPLEWAETLVPTECGHLMGQPNPDPPATVCDRLYGLAFKAPPRIRGRVKPTRKFFRSPQEVKLPGIAARGSQGEDYTAIYWDFFGR